MQKTVHVVANPSACFIPYRHVIITGLDLLLPIASHELEEGFPSSRDFESQARSFELEGPASLGILLPVPPEMISARQFFYNVTR